MNQGWNERSRCPDYLRTQMPGALQTKTLANPPSAPTRPVKPANWLRTPSPQATGITRTEHRTAPVPSARTSSLSGPFRFQMTRASQASRNSGPTSPVRQPNASRVAQQQAVARARLANQSMLIPPRRASNPSRPVQPHTAAAAMPAPRWQPPGQRDQKVLQGQRLLGQKAGSCGPSIKGSSAQSLNSGASVVQGLAMKALSAGRDTRSTARIQLQAWRKTAPGNKSKYTPVPVQNEAAGRANLVVSRASAGAGVVQRVIYHNMNALFQAAVGAHNAPNIGQFDASLRSLIADAERQLPVVDVQAVPNLNRTAEAEPNPAPPPPYRLRYDPNEPNREWLLSSILHELTHVSAARNYDRRGALPNQLAGTWATNLNLPALSAEQDLQIQIAVLRQNLDDLDEIARTDTTLPNQVRDHIRDQRYPYASVLAWFEYDSVLSDIMMYMQLNNVPTNSPTFKFVRRLVKEAQDRRLKRPLWSIKRARRVDRNAWWFQFWKW